LRASAVSERTQLGFLGLGPFFGITARGKRFVDPLEPLQADNVYLAERGRFELPKLLRACRFSSLAPHRDPPSPTKKRRISLALAATPQPCDSPTQACQCQLSASQRWRFRQSDRWPKAPRRYITAFSQSVDPTAVAVVQSGRSRNPVQRA